MTDQGIRVRNRDRLATTPARETALACVEAGIDAARPDRAVAGGLERDGDRLRVRGVADDGTDLDLADFDRVLVLGGGKASAGMASALEPTLGDRIDRGVVVTDDPGDGSGGPGDGEGRTGPGRIDVVAASHPIPDERGVAGARRVLDLADDADGETLVVALLSGGASALLPAPAAGIDLAALQSVTDALLDAGAPIGDVNAVRKHCSSIKGGHLARRAAPATVLTLAISDVVGDDPGVIGSGPTAPDPTTFADARAALDRHGVDPPAAVAERLAAGERDDLAETPKPGDPAFDRASYHLLATGRTAVDAAREVARDRGYRTLVLSSRIRGESREAALAHAAVAEESLATGDPVDPPAVVLSGGETTVTVRGDGAGGPNAEFALAAALELVAGPDPLDDPRRVALAAVDTDGRDGPGDAEGGDGPGDAEGGDGPGDAAAAGNVAGAVVDGTTVGDPAPARRALGNSDAHGYLDGRGALVRTGPTGTNVNDLRVLVVEGDD